MTKRVKIDIEEAIDMISSNEDNGVCLECGEICYGNVEPDAKGYMCEDCGVNGVYGLEEALIMGVFL